MVNELFDEVDKIASIVEEYYIICSYLLLTLHVVLRGKDFKKRINKRKAIDHLRYESTLPAPSER